MIRQDRLEAQLIAGLTERISKPEAIEYALRRFHEHLQQRLRELQEQTLKLADTVTTLQNQRRELKGKANNLGEAIAKMGYSATLLQQLSAIEVEIERIDESLAAANQPLDVAFSLESVRDFVATKALDMKGAFDTEPGKARQILANHIERLILTPRDAEDGPVYDVSGDIDLFGGDQRTMSLVVDACMGRSGKAKRGAKRAAASEDANMYRVDRKGVMATEAVSGHHFHATHKSSSRALQAKLGGMLAAMERPVASAV
jgi:hypothetical protein